MLRLVSVILVMVAASSAAAEARIALKDDRAIEQGLVVVAAGNLLRKTCDGISPRVFKAYSFAQSLEARARDLGYSRSEIEAYLDSDADKERVKAKARQYLQSRGANLEDRSSLCAIGQREIASGTQIGKLLRTN